MLAEFNGKLQFMSNPKYGETVADVLTPLREKELTKNLLEVLATVAYKQPVTRVEIDQMRGNKSSAEYALTGLLKAGLIEAVGRKDTVGRPLLYGTTDEFLKKFGISSIEELPDYDEVLENLLILNGPSQETLFHNRTIMDEDALEDETLAGQAAADNIDDEVDEIPEFLAGENFEVFD